MRAHNPTYVPAPLTVSLHKRKQPKRPAAGEGTADRGVPAQWTRGAHTSLGTLKCLPLREEPALCGPTYMERQGRERFQVPG